MDAFTRAVPDFVITMCQSIRYAEHGFAFGENKEPYRFLPSLSSLYSPGSNPSSTILKFFHHLLGEVAVPATHASCEDPLQFLLMKGSFKSARHRLCQAASRERQKPLNVVAQDSLRPLLRELLIPSSSWPIVGMNRSDPCNCRPNDLLLINMEVKLHLEIYDPSNLPICLCGATIDAFSLHPFSCRQVSKMVMHNRINESMEEPMCVILKMAGVVGKGGRVVLEPKRLLLNTPGLRPLDAGWQPNHSLKSSTLAPSSFTMFGYDITITPPQGHRPPSRSSAASSKQSAPAAKHLIEKERKKLMRDGKSDPHNNTSMSGEEIIGAMLEKRIGLLPFAINPHGAP